MQRAGRYLAGATRFPDAMRPAIARQAITAFTAPGDVVGDPLCGFGVTVVEAARLERSAIGITHRARAAAIAGTHLAHAGQAGMPGRGVVLRADPRVRVPGASWWGRWRLLLTAVSHRGPLGPTWARAGRGIRIGRGDRTAMVLHGLAQVLRRCLPLLAADATVVLVTRAYRHGVDLVDFPSMVLDAAVSVGLRPRQRCVALRVAVHDDIVHGAPVGSEAAAVRDARAAGARLDLVGHDDILVLAAPTPPIVTSATAQVAAVGRWAA